MRNRRDAERNNMGKSRKKREGEQWMEVLLKAQYAAAQNKEPKMSETGHSQAPITEREGWKRRVEQCRSVPCREDVFLSVLVAPLLSHNGVQNEAEQRGQWSQRKGIKIWAVLYMLDTLGKLNSSDSFLSCTTLPDNNQLLNMLCVFALVED